MNRSEAIKLIRNTLFILLISTAIGFILLCVAYFIPNKFIEYTRQDLKQAMDFETPKWIDTRFFTYAYGSKNMPDTFVYRLLAEDESSPLLIRAMGGSDEGDNRYWDGFMVIIRPLAAVFSYGQLRFLFTLLDIFLIWYIITKSNRRLPWYFSFSFVIGLVLINMHVNFYSIMLNMLFLVTFVAMALILRFYSTKTRQTDLFYFFLLDGILTTYFDRYTATLLTLEMPLLIIILLNLYEPRESVHSSLKRNLQNIACAIIGWGTGFSVFWANKWLIASLILKRNIITSALKQAQGRATTNASEMLGYEVENTGGRLFTIAKNISSLVPTHGENILSLAILFLICAAVMGIIFFVRKGRLCAPPQKISSSVYPDAYALRLLLYPE